MVAPARLRLWQAAYRQPIGARWLLKLENCHGSPEVRVRGVEKFDHERMMLEHFLHDAPLHALAASVDQAHLRETGIVRGAHVFVDD
jgi:hypothetical protein